MINEQESTNFIGYVIIVRLCYDRILFEDIMHKLRSNDDFDLPIRRLWTGIHKLAGLASPLALRRCLCQ